MKQGWKIFMIFVLLIPMHVLSGDNDAIHDEFDSDIGRLGEQIREHDRVIADVRVDVARIADHGHPDHENRIRILEAEVERFHGTLSILKWLVGVIATAGALTGIVPLIRNMRHNQHGPPHNTRGYNSRVTSEEEYQK